MRGKSKSGTLRSVGAKRLAKDISQEPKMKELKRFCGDMTEAEKSRTLDHLNRRCDKSKKEGCYNGNFDHRRYRRIHMQTVGIRPYRGGFL